MFFSPPGRILMLWSIVERYTAFRHVPALELMKRIKRLDDEPAFRSAVVNINAVGSAVIDVRDPDDKIVIGLDDDRASEYFYQVRSNLSHRGKSAFRDGQLVFSAPVQLHDADATCPCAATARAR